MSDSKPLMFIDSIQEINEAKKETQKNVSLNRIDDIKAMLYYKMEVKTKNTLIEGVVKSVDENGLTIEADNKLEVIKLDEIVHINILRLQGLKITRCSRNRTKALNVANAISVNC